MTESTTGIILRTRPLTETSLTIHWLTPDLGRIATVAKGARRAKSPFAGKVDLFYAGDFSFSRSRHSDLHTLREVSLRDTHEALRTDLFKLQQAAYAANLIEQTTETETPLPEIFTLAGAFLNFLCQQPPQPLSIMALEIKMLRELGLEPDLNEVRLTPGTRKIVESVIENGWTAVQRLRPSGAQAAELRQWLHGFLIFHLGHLPKGRGPAVAGH